MVGAGESDLGRFIEPVARVLLGDPNLHLSSKTELRFGHHGSMSIDLEKGTAYSHEETTGGGVLWLIEHEKGLTGKDAFEFMRQIGCDIEAKANGKHPEPPVPRRIVATYDYLDESGNLLFQVCRFEPKQFAQRSPDGSWKVKGIRQVPYRLPELMEAISNEQTVFIVEGEKDSDNLAKWGITATCNAGGCGKWKDDLSSYFSGADVVLIPDNDPPARHDKTKELRRYPEDHDDFPNELIHPGQDHMELVARSVSAMAKSVRVLNLPGLPLKGDVSDWIAGGGTPDNLWELVSQAPVWSRRVAPIVLTSRFGGLRWEEIGATVAGNTYAWAVEDIIPIGEITLAFGDSGTGKSFNMFDMAMCVARGLQFNGKNVEPGLVVYVAAEAGKGFGKRKIAYAQHHGLGPEAFPFYLMTKRPDFFGSDTDADNLAAEIKAIKKIYPHKLVLIVLDTLSALAPGMNENASQDVSRVRARLVKISEEFPEAAIILVHHKPKGGSTPRGHGSLTADFETTIEFETTAERTEGLPIHRGTVRKQREGKSGVCWEFTLPVVDVGKNKWGNPETSCVVVPFTAKRATATGGFRATKTELVFLEALFDAINSFGVAPPDGLPASITKAVDLSEVREKMRLRFISGETDSTKADSRFRQAFKRAADALKAGSVIGYRKPLCWYTGKPVNGLNSSLIAHEVET